MERMCEDGFLRREQKEQLIVETELPILFSRLKQFEYRLINKWKC